MQERRKHRIVKNVWIGIATCLTVAGAYCTYLYVIDPPPLFLTDAVDHHHVYLNRGMLLLGWGVIFLAWKGVPWQDNDP